VKKVVAIHKSTKSGGYFVKYGTFRLFIVLVILVNICIPIENIIFSREVFLMDSRKAKLFGGFFLTASLVFSSLFSVTAGASSIDSNADKIRVLIQADKGKSSLKREYGERHDFGKRGFTTDVTPEQLEALKNNKNLTVKLVDTVSIYETVLDTSAESTSTVSDQSPWGIEAIYQNSSIASTTGGAGIRVAVLDTGAKIDHRDLAGSAEQCNDFSQMKSPLVKGTCSDKNGHGTHVAGTVLAHGGSDGQGIYGVSPEAKLWAYKVLNDRGSGYSDDIAYAIRYAADEGANLGVHVVISMSLGSSSKNSLIADAVTYANSKGALVVAAAGNSGPNEDTIGYPGALADAVAVAALENAQENGTFRVADFSSRGNPTTADDYVIVERDVEVSAPGRAIESTWYDGGYNTISGTSMATPHISGLAAKIWASNPSWSNQNLRAELQSRAKGNDINGGLHSATGDDISAGFGFPVVKSTDQ
jgi:subtilisin